MRWEFDPFAVLYQGFAWGDPALECYQMTFQFTTLCPNSFSQSRDRFFMWHMIVTNYALNGAAGVTRIAYISHSLHFNIYLHHLQTKNLDGLG